MALRVPSARNRSFASRLLSSTKGFYVGESVRHPVSSNRRRPVRPWVKAGYLDMERRWLSLARSYEFAERLTNFVEPFRKRWQRKE